MSGDNNNSAQIIPGRIIRPQITLPTAKALAERLYGVKVLTIDELNSYDDKNYRVILDPDQVSNKHIKKLCPDGYVLKILNVLDSQTKHVDAEHAMQKHLREHGINCPYPELNIHGEEHSLETLKIERELSEPDSTQNNTSEDATSQHIVRMLVYIPGKLLIDVPYTREILTQAGEFLGRISKALLDFRHPALDTHKTMWSLQSVPLLVDFAHTVKDPSDRQLVLDVIKAYKEEIEPNYHKFRPSSVHGDFHEQNILLTESQEMALLDFGDSHYTYTVMEVAVGLAHGMMAAQDIKPADSAYYFMNGFSRQVQLNDSERSALHTLVISECCLLAVTSANSLTLSPGEPYIIKWEKKALHILRKLWNMDRNILQVNVGNLS